MAEHEPSVGNDQRIDRAGLCPGLRRSRDDPDPEWRRAPSDSSMTIDTFLTFLPATSTARIARVTSPCRMARAPSDRLMPSLSMSSILISRAR